MEHNLKQAFFGVPVPSHNPWESRGDTADGSNRNWERRRDEEIRWAVMTALHWDLAVPRNSVEVAVKGGWVTLTGQVRRAYESSCSEADASMTAGVVGVTNAIECKPA